MGFFGILKKTAIFAAGLIMAAVIVTLILAVSAGVINHDKYAKALGIKIPTRDADVFADTHGGFVGDGDMTEIFYLSDDENKKIAAEIEKSGVWSEIDGEAEKKLYRRVWEKEGNAYEYGGFFPEDFPEPEDALYCFFNKQNGEHAFPEGKQYSYNYIAGLYSESEKTLWIYELDT